MIIALFLGILIGFLTNVPIGPINAAVVTRGLREHFSSGMAVGVGAAFMDFIYCAAAMYGISFVSDEPWVNASVQIAGFVILLLFGIKSLRTHTDMNEMQSKGQKVQKRVEQKFGLPGPFFLGVLIYLSNPSFFPYWLGVSALLQKYHLLLPTHVNNLTFALGVGSGSALWFYLVLHFILSSKFVMKPSILNGIYKFSGVALLGFAAYLGYRLVMFTDWIGIYKTLTHTL